ncbi:MAG: hypothetical protein M1829_005720 [Trizodia sp. TS-e1964]|nr:MAG: hypothetical protein M1829_005720 [Trizodia sp. TS-e1964]
MASAARKKIVVCGGNGFLGSRICKSAVARGWDVTSISRSGEPTWSAVTSSPEPPSWSSSVSWQKADILKPSTYQPLLKDADAVVHSMGILLEADYKGVLQGKEPIYSGLQRAFSTYKSGSQNPLERKPGEDLHPEGKDGQLTYELMNRDSAISLAQEASAANVSTFVYISAAAGAPILPKRYITTKREAESTIATTFPRIRTIFLRPGFLYDSSRAFTMPLAALTGVAATVNSLVGGSLSWLMGAGGTKPLKVDLVAEAVMQAIGDEEVRGVLETPTIEELANKAWRGGML